MLLELALRHAAGRWGNQFEAETNEILLAGQRVLLVAPQTYMNLSGRSVRQVVNFYKPPLEDLLVVCDDLNLDCGRLRMRRSGSAGGQKGLKNIIDQLGTNDVSRLRIGIGRPAGGGDTVNYVLAPFAKSERPTVDEAIRTAADAVEAWVRDGIDQAMNEFNRGEGGN